MRDVLAYGSWRSLRSAEETTSHIVATQLQPALPRPKTKKKNLCFAKVLLFGARCETWTHTISHTPLKRARLPIPPISHCLSIIVEIAQFVNCFFAKNSRNFQNSLQLDFANYPANLLRQTTKHFETKILPFLFFVYQRNASCICETTWQQRHFPKTQQDWRPFVRDVRKCTKLLWSGRSWLV